MRVILTGAAGFLGSHLADRLIADGFEVFGVDNFATGRRSNLSHLLPHPRFSFRDADVCEPLAWDGPVDWVLHVASPASPLDYLAQPIETMRVSAEGSRHLLDLAQRSGARFLLTSSSEVYGDAQVHPHTEDYRGNVSTTGPRSVYQEAKRYAEALTSAYARSRGVPVRIARVFNAYGPRMRPTDGRVVSTFVVQALRGEPLRIHGDGRQTRSLQYVDDLVEGLRRLMDADYGEPVNLGSPVETTVMELAELIIELTGSRSTIETWPAVIDDPRRRRPDITRARQLLDWEPRVALRDGLSLTIAHFRAELDAGP